MSEKPKLWLEKESHYIIITKDDCDTRVRYDLKNKKLERQKIKPKKETVFGVYQRERNGDDWEEVSQQYKFFQDYHPQEINTKDDKFKKMLLRIAETFKHCKSISTFLAYIDDCSFYEGYIYEGIEFEHYEDFGSSWGGGGSYSVRGITQPITYYDKLTLKYFKENGVKVTKEIERRYTDSKVIFQGIIAAVDNSDIPKNMKAVILNDVLNSDYSLRNFKQLVEQYKYDVKALLRFVYNYLVPFENLRPYDCFELLKDYYSMAFAIGRNAKKYPKYLKSMHDIILSNYNAYKKEYPEDIFLKFKKPELEYENDTDKLCIIVPNSTKEVISEGTDLNHCVSSYVDKIIKGETYIMFLRSKKEKSSSLITVEYKDNKIVQARGSYNRVLNDDEKKFLHKYAKQKMIEITM